MDTTSLHLQGETDQCRVNFKSYKGKGYPVKTEHLLPILNMTETNLEEAMFNQLQWLQNYFLNQ